MRKSRRVLGMRTRFPPKTMPVSDQAQWVLRYIDVGNSTIAVFDRSKRSNGWARPHLPVPPER
jgi:hypothetical protein